MVRRANRGVGGSEGVGGKGEGTGVAGQALEQRNMRGVRGPDSRYQPHI